MPLGLSEDFVKSLTNFKTVEIPTAESEYKRQLLNEKKQLLEQAKQLRTQQLKKKVQNENLEKEYQNSIKPVKEKPLLDDALLKAISQPLHVSFDDKSIKDLIRYSRDHHWGEKK